MFLSFNILFSALYSLYSLRTMNLSSFVVTASHNKYIRKCVIQYDGMCLRSEERQRKWIQSKPIPSHSFRYHILPFYLSSPAANGVLYLKMKHKLNPSLLHFAINFVDQLFFCTSILHSLQNYIHVKYLPDWIVNWFKVKMKMIESS